MNEEKQQNVGTETDGRIQHLRSRLGDGVVLVPVPPGQKGPTQPGWNKATIERMNDPAYLAELNVSNIGVLLGKASGNLCSIDIDRDEDVEPFLELNPRLQPSLRTKGSRGANIWVRVAGDYPKLTKIPNGCGDWGEWRADGGQTIIDGLHPNGNRYTRLVDAPPVEIAYNDIKWPDGLKPPKLQTACKEYDELVSEFGQPFAKSDKGRIMLNQRFFVGRFAREHLVLFEAEEAMFYCYDPENGLWAPQSQPSIREMFARDLKAAADLFGEPKITMLITRSLVSDLTEMLKGHIEKKDVFKHRKRLIHTKNCMINLDAEPPEILAFNPDYFSRNQLPIRFDETADCPRFRGVLEEVLNPEDITLLIRWAGCSLLGVNLPQRLMVLSGLEDTGKSTIATIIEGIIGVENVATLRTKHLADRFELSGFLGKTLLTGKDVAGNFLNLEGAHQIKALCGGDLLDAEKKGAGMFHLKGEFNILITSNSRLWLKLDGDAGAWRRRLLIIEFNKRRTTKNVPELAKTLLCEEGPGILNLFIGGARQLLTELSDNGGYALTAAQQDRILRLVSESNSVREFVAQRVVATEGMNVTTDALVAAYTQFCQRRKWHPLPAGMVERQLPDAMMEVHCAARRNDIGTTNGTQRGYSGFAIHPNGEEAQHVA